MNGTRPSTTSSTTTTQKPLKLCFPKDAKHMPENLLPLPPFVTIIECGSSQYCDRDGYLKLFIISYLINHVTYYKFECSHWLKYYLQSECCTLKNLISRNGPNEVQKPGSIKRHEFFVHSCLSVDPKTSCLLMDPENHQGSIKRHEVLGP